MKGLAGRLSQDMAANGNSGMEPAIVCDKFQGIDTWVFDLDDTLYPAASGVQQQIRDRIVLFIGDYLNIGIAEAASRRLTWYERYGAALNGLVNEHGLDPISFLDFVHNVDLAILDRDENLVRAIEALPGRRMVFTNSSRRHAQSVLAALGIDSLFDEVCHIEDRGFVSKPQEAAYDCLLKRHGVAPGGAAIFDDAAANLVLPKAHGMRTVLVVPAALEAGAASMKPLHIDAVTGDLAAFLSVYSRNAGLEAAAGKMMPCHQQSTRIGKQE
jgi:putative hydrolase of the HAD superfamily